MQVFFLIFIVGVHLTLTLGGIISIYWSEFIQSNLRKRGINFIEVFANVPFIVYGYLLLLFAIKAADYQANALINMLLCSIILGLMMLPMIVYKFIGILQSISYQQREGAYSLGASRYRTAIMVLIPSQTKLFIAAIIRIATRAFCEILIVLLVAGFTTEKLEVIISIFLISIISIIISQWLTKSHNKNGAA